MLYIFLYILEVKGTLVNEHENFLLQTFSSAVRIFYISNVIFKLNF